MGELIGPCPLKLPQHLSQKNKTCLFCLLRSRGTRERILILFRGQKPRFLDCKLAAPLSFCRSFGPPFGVAWAENEARSCFGVFRSVHGLAFFLLFDVLMFSWNWFSLRWQSTKRNAVPVQTGLSSFDLRRKRTKSSQSTCIQDDLRFRSFTIARLS